MALRDVIKNVLNESAEEQLDEKVQVGGGATGASEVAEPTGVRAKAPGNSKDQGEGMQKIADDGVNSVEDTDPENNTKAEGDAAKNAASIATKSGSMKEHVSIIFDGEDLSEEFKEKASTLFEAAINERLAEVTSQLEEQFENKLAEQIQQIEEEAAEELVELASKIDDYMTYVVEQWMEANEVAIESSLRSEITEEFIGGLKNLFTEHYIDIPEEKVNVVEELSARVAELEDRLNEQVNENIELSRAINEKVGEEIFNEISEGLAATQVEKLKKLTEGVEFDGVDAYKKKLSIIKENYFPSAGSKKAASSGLLEESFEGEDTPTVPSHMARYVDAISRTIVKK